MFHPRRFVCLFVSRGLKDMTFKTQLGLLINFNHIMVVYFIALPLFSVYGDESRSLQSLTLPRWIVGQFR